MVLPTLPVMIPKLGIMGARPSRLVLLLGAVTIAATVALTIRSRDLVVYNYSPSLPVGFYLRTDAVLARGAIVTLRAVAVAPDYASARHFADEGDRFIKRIAAMEGDVVCADNDAITINDRTVAHRAAVDAAGRVLPTWSGCRALTSDDVFVLGDTQDSFDGRYFGSVTKSDIEGVWRRLGP